MRSTAMTGTVVAVALLLAGCGGSTSGGGASAGGSAAASGSGASASGAAPGVAMDAQLHGRLPADVKSNGTLTMATDATIGSPFASFAADNKTIVGLNVDLAQAIGTLLGVKVKVVNTPFGTFIPGLQAHRYDFSISVMLDTKEREKVVDFIDYIKDGSGFLLRADDSRTNLKLADLCGVKAAAIKGSVEADDLTTQSAACKKAGKAPVNISIFDENAQGVLALTSQRVDVWVGDSDQNAWLKTQNNGKVKQSGKPFNAAIDGIALPKNSALVPVMKDAVQKLMDSGAYLGILKHYGVGDGAIKKATLNNAQY